MLSPEQLADYRREGYLVLPGFVPDSECLALRRHVMGLTRSFDPVADGVSTVFSSSDREHAQDTWFLESGDKLRYFFEQGVFDEAGQLSVPIELALNKLGHALHDLDPVFDAFSRRAALAQVCTDLGIDDPRLLQSMYIFKGPGRGGEVGVHTDHAFLWTEPRSVVGFWFAIDDATKENGCLFVLPGEHRGPVRSRFRREGQGTTLDVLDETPYPLERAVPLEVSRGTLVILDGQCPHGSERNESAQPRHAYSLHVIDGVSGYAADNWLQRGPELPLRGFGA
jgi:phytanoyl-CoA hydroxylase